MAVPDYQTLMLPLLRFYADNAVHSLNEAIDALAKEFKLTDEDLRLLLPSGRQSTFRNRVGWARTYMSKAGLLATVKRGHSKITQPGLQVLAGNPTRIDARFLRQFHEKFERFVRNPVLRVIKVDAQRFGRHPHAARGVIGKKLSHV